MAYLSAYDQSLRPAIDAIDEVSRLLAQSAGIQLPKIVVLGDQSSGKSSLIESIFGFSLPRGEDIVTRTPIQVEHRHSKDREDAVLSYKADPDSDHMTHVRIESLGGIEAAVREATDAVAGTSKGIRDSTIYLRVHSHRLPDLTVLDLPGITRNAVEGQPENIEEIITAMINRHIEGSMTVLLCVVQANVDFSTAAAIKLAKAHDPERDRTMGVVTKIDLVEAGTDMVAKLEGSGSNLKLKLGFIPVRNGTAEELRSGTPLDDVRANESRFFDNHPQLGSLAQDRRGIDALVAQLVRVQLDCIVTSLPALKTQVREKLESSREQLESLDQTVVSTAGEAASKAQRLLTQLEVLYLELCRGEFGRLAGRARAPAGAGADLFKVSRRVFELADDFRAEIEKVCQLPWFLGAKCFAELKELVKDARGVALPNFLSHAAFQAMFERHVHAKLLSPCLELVEQTRAYIEEVLCALVDLPHLLKPFPRLATLTKDQVQGLLREKAGKAKQHVKLLIRAERQVMTLNHYYADTLNKIKGRHMQEVERQGQPQYAFRGATPQAGASSPFVVAAAAPANPPLGYGSPATPSKPSKEEDEKEGFVEVRRLQLMLEQRMDQGVQQQVEQLRSEGANAEEARWAWWQGQRSGEPAAMPAEQAAGQRQQQQAQQWPRPGWRQPQQGAFPPTPAAPASASRGAHPAGPAGGAKESSRGGAPAERGDCWRTPAADEEEAHEQAALEKLAACKSNEDQGIVEMQISLMAYTKVVMKRVYDSVALGVRLLLVEEVGEQLADCVQQGLHESAAGSPDGLLPIMADARQARQRDELRRIVDSLEKAWARLKNVSMG